MAMKFKILLVISSLALTLSLMSNTYSRYVAGATSNVEMQFASWQILVNENDITSATTSSIELIPNIEANEHIANNTIAPSSKGYFDINIDPTNVNVSFGYEVALEVLNKNMPDLVITKYALIDSNYVEGDELEINTISNSTIEGTLNYDNTTEYEPLGVTKEQIMCETGTLGIPEFGTNFTISLVSETKPKTFAELIKISGLSHGTDVWVGNAQELIKNKIVPFKDVIGCRDDIMVYLMYNGLEPIKAFKIMEFVRKGKASKDPETWAGYKETMKKAGIADWFIDSCGKIKYMFPKAHATAYVISAFRIAYFKVHYPAWFYASWFSTKATDFDIEVMIKGYQAIKNRMEEIINKGYDASNKESGILESLRLALEATARGIKIANVDLNNSEAKTFKVDGDILIPPFSTIDGLGDTVAKKIVEERIKAPFLSVEDLQKRAKVSNTIIEKMRMMGILDELNESNQLSLNLF